MKLVSTMRLAALSAAALLSFNYNHAEAYADEHKFKVSPAPDRHEGQGPYSQLILREVTVINGTGAPAFGPADIVIEGNKIT